jgi:hypothetical protein
MPFSSRQMPLSACVDRTGFGQFDRSTGHSESIVIGGSVRIWLW